MKQLAFSVTKKDLVIQTFRAGGKGGQNQNKRETGVRIIHPPSGAVGEARDGREQGQNKKAALKRMAEHHKFKLWVMQQMNEGRADIEGAVNTSMAPENIKVEYFRGGKWVVQD